MNASASANEPSPSSESHPAFYAQTSSVAARLERLPLSRFHWVFLVILGVAMLFDGYDLTMAGFVIPSLMKTGWIDKAGAATFIGAPLLAAAVGSVAAGFIGDKIGRRRLFQAMVLLYCLASLGCGLAPDYPFLLGCRTLNLFALGVLTVTGYAYMNEFTPRAFRGRFQSAISLVLNGGLPVGALLAWGMMPHVSTDMGWRLMFLASVLPAVLLLANRRALPESPRWLVSVGRDREAMEIVEHIEQRILQTGTALATPERLPAPTRNLSWKSLFARGTRSRMALAVLFNVCHLVSIFVMVSWLPSILRARGVGENDTLTFTAVIFAGGFLGPILGMLLADRFDRRWSIVGAALAAALSGVAYSQQSTPLPLMITGLVMVSAIYYISSVGFATYIPEILPTGARLRGLGLAAFVGRLAAAGSPFAVAAALRALNNPAWVVACVGALYVIMALAIGCFGPKTHGKTLEMLEAQSPDAAASDQDHAPVREGTPPVPTAFAEARPAWNAQAGPLDTVDSVSEVVERSNAQSNVVLPSPPAHSSQTPKPTTSSLPR